MTDRDGPRPPRVSGQLTGHDWLSHVAVLPPVPGVGAALELRRAWPRHPGHVLLEYADREENDALVAGQWLADGDELRRLAEATAAAAGPHAATAALPSHGVLLQRAGADRRLTALVRLSARPDTRLVAHRPERRAVLRLEPTGPAEGGRRWMKVVRRHRLPSVVLGAAHLAPLGAAVPRLVDVATENGVTVWTELPGRPLSGLLAAPGLPTTMIAVGALIRRLHGLAAPVDPARVHDARAEQAVLRRWTAHLESFEPAIHAAVLRPVRRALALLEEGTPTLAGLVTVHRDLHDGQLLVDRNQVGLLDPDTVAAGEPELDLGDLRAHLWLGACQGRCDVATAADAADALLDGYGRDAVDGQRLLVYTAAALLRLVAVHAFRPGTSDCLPALREEAERLLGAHAVRAGA